MTRGEPAVRHPTEAEEYYTDERCYILEVWNFSSDPAASIARARVEPGVSTQVHRVRDTAERYFIVRGRGLVEIGGLPPDVVAEGDMVYIPPGRPQRITNLGNEDLVFLAICTPRFVPEAYENVY